VFVAIKQSLHPAAAIGRKITGTWGISGVRVQMKTTSVREVIPRCIQHVSNDNY